jgi:predicted nucleic-acid-binding protein
MIAVDTNVVVRLLTDDDAEQTRNARAMLAKSTVWIATTVLVETDWVLRGRYGYKPAAVRDAIARLAGLENVRLEDATLIGAALLLVDNGLQFADAIHVVSTPADASFASFDQVLVRRARRAGLSHVFDPSQS